MENTVKNTISVHIRVRPVLKREMTSNEFTQCLACKNDIIYVSKSNKPIVINSKSDSDNLKDVNIYKFDNVFDQNTSQDSMFDIVGKNALKSAIEGYNVTLFAYGQTGSGKTFTIEGDSKNPGLIPSVMQLLFETIEKERADDPSQNTTVTLSVAQIYMEKVSDLLDFDEKAADLKVSKIDNAFVCRDLSEISIKSISDGVKYFQLATQNRVTASTQMNNASSRGHVIYTLKIIKATANNKISFSKFNLVDLAGSERISKSGTTGANLKESISINQSLFTLQGVVDALTNPNSSQKKIPPFRESKLTQLLMDSLGGNCLTSLIATVSPSITESKETISTLNFASSCKKILLHATKNFVDEKEEARLRLYGNSPKKAVEKKKKEIPWKKVVPSVARRSIVTSLGEIAFLESIHEDDKVQRKIILLLHAHPSESEEFLHWFPALTSYANYKVYAIDQKGMGRSPGQQCQCNSKFHYDKGGPCDVVMAFLKAMNITTKIAVGGYDWGAGISLSLGLKYPQSFERIIAFLPSFAEHSGKEIKFLNVPVLVLWVQLDQFHPWSKWKSLAEKIPNRTIEIIKVKGYSTDLLGNSYESLSELMLRPIVMFLGCPDPLSDKEEIKEAVKAEKTDTKGNKVIANLNINFSDEVSFDKLSAQVSPSSIKEFMKLYEEQGSQMYESLSDNKSILTQIIRALPEISFDVLDKNPNLFVDLGVWTKIPSNLDIMLNRRRYFPGRKVLCMVPCSNVAMINGEPNPIYLKYDENESESYLSPYCSVISFDNGKFEIEAECSNGDITEFIVDEQEIFKYNNGQSFKKNNLNQLELEDGIRANYSNPLVKAKLLEIAINLKPIVESMDFEADDIEIYQRKAVLIIRNSLNIVSFYRGVVRERYGRTDCLGKLAINGQAQCHGLSSTISGYLYPFKDILGLDLLYRGGSSYLNDYVNKTPGAIKCTNNIESHQWLQITLRPTFSSFVVDVWYQEQFQDHKYLFVDLKTAMQTISYPHPKLLLKNEIIA